MELLLDLFDFEDERHGLVKRGALLCKIIVILLAAVKVAGLGPLQEILVRLPQCRTPRLIQRPL